MDRPLRIEYAGALYHVTARGNERKRAYFTKRDHGKFKECIKQALSRLKEGVVSRKETSHRRLLESKVYHRMSKAVEENRTLRKKVAKLFLLCPNSRADPVPFTLSSYPGPE